MLVDQIAIEQKLVTAMVQNEPAVRKALSVRSRWVGSNKAVDMVIAVDSALSTAKPHKVADTVEQLLAEKFGVTETSIHIEPEI